MRDIAKSKANFSFSRILYAKRMLRRKKFNLDNVIINTGNIANVIKNLIKFSLFSVSRNILQFSL